MSELVGFLPGPDGLFEFPSPFDDESTFIHAFFVVRALRRQGVGRAAAVDLLRSRRGRWAIAFLEENDSAARVRQKPARVPPE